MSRAQQPVKTSKSVMLRFGQVPEETLGEGMVEHPYRLRKDLDVRLALPADLTRVEAGRLAAFIQTLPFGDGGVEPEGPRPPSYIVSCGICGIPFQASLVWLWGRLC